MSASRHILELKRNPEKRKRMLAEEKDLSLSKCRDGEDSLYRRLSGLGDADHPQPERLPLEEANWASLSPSANKAAEVIEKTAMEVFRIHDIDNSEAVAMQLGINVAKSLDDKNLLARIDMADLAEGCDESVDGGSMAAAKEAGHPISVKEVDLSSLSETPDNEDADVFEQALDALKICSRAMLLLSGEAPEGKKIVLQNAHKNIRSIANDIASRIMVIKNF